MEELSPWKLKLKLCPSKVTQDLLAKDNCKRVAELDVFGQREIQDRQYNELCVAVNSYCAAKETSVNIFVLFFLRALLC